MGAPWFQMRDLARRHGIVGLSSNYTPLWRHEQQDHNHPAQLLSEVYSIDESFLDLAGMDGIWESPTRVGQDIRARIFQWTSLPVCVGIGSSKTIAN
jgi:DNA polymerase V